MAEGKDRESVDCKSLIGEVARLARDRLGVEGVTREVEGGIVYAIPFDLGGVTVLLSVACADGDVSVLASIPYEAVKPDAGKLEWLLQNSLQGPGYWAIAEEAGARMLMYVIELRSADAEEAVRALAAAATVLLDAARELGIAPRGSGGEESPSDTSRG